MSDEIKFQPVDERGDRNRALFIVLVIILVAVLSFGLGRYSKIAEANTNRTIMFTEVELPIQKGNETKGTLVASKTGTRYYYLWCAGVN